MTYADNATDPLSPRILDGSYLAGRRVGAHNVEMRHYKKSITKFQEELIAMAQMQFLISVFYVLHVTKTRHSKIIRG